MSTLVILHLKDRLRRFRYGARREADAVDRMLVSAGALLSQRPAHPIGQKGPFRDLLDRALLGGEGVLRGLLARPRRRPAAVGDHLVPVDVLFGRSAGDPRSIGFARSYFRAAGILLCRLGVKNAYVSEH